MPILYLTRREHFNAAHRLFNPDWSKEQNELVFGKCANENWHGHNFELFVTVLLKPEDDWLAAIEELLNVKMNKGEQLSYWGADELTDSQKEYAKKDVVYLKPLMEKIKWMVQRENRWPVAEHMCATLPACVLAEAYHFDPANLINYA
jgi:6-pyruvoyl-tetrahydropterin synthase